MTQQGQAAANLTPYVASNRTGVETEGEQHITFYGSSFIADEFGKKVAELSRDEEGIAVHTFDLDAVAATRHAWGVFRDRRPDLYGPLLTKDGGR
jgi:N-carbamoylputrescine amidase